MTLEANAREIAQIAIERAGDARRFIIAFAGPPGVGKSTLSERLVSELSNRGETAAIVPMDGFHLDNAVLEPRGDRPRKGAPFTFDADGFRVLLERLRSETQQDIAIPVFDRDLDLARAGARMISPQHRFLIAEGNYLLLDQEPWSKMAGLFDLTVMLTADPDILRKRLIQRWLDQDLSPEKATARAMGNDIPNAELVMTASRPAELIVNSGD